MNILTGLVLFPLQVTASDVKLATSSDQVLIFICGVMIAVTILVILITVKGKSAKSAKTNKTNKAIKKHAAAASHPREFSAYTLHRLTSNMELDREQVKMLDYVLRSGGIRDPEQFLNSPELIDRHFKRTYRLIEQNSSSEEDLHERLAVLFAARNAIESNPSSVLPASTRQIPSQTAAVLTVNKVNYPVQVISSQGDELLIENPKKSGGGTIPFPKGSKANLAFFAKSSKGFSIETSILGSIGTTDGPALQLAHSSQIQKLSNRRHRRRQTLIATVFYFVFLSGGNNKKITVDKKRHVGNILDISIGGCSIKTNIPVNVGQRIKIEFICEDNSSIAALGGVLRASHSESGTIMHIHFLKVPLKSLNLINALVYEYIET